MAISQSKIKHMILILIVFFTMGCVEIRLQYSGPLFPGTSAKHIANPHNFRQQEKDSKKPPALPPLALEFENDLANDPYAWNRHGIKLFNKGHYEKALTAYNQAIIMKADDPKFWNNKGAALAKLERYKEALAAYDAALAFRPKFAQAWHNKGIALAKLNRIEEALEAYEEVIRLAPDDAEAWKNKTVALAILGRYFKALDAIERALRINPDFKDALELREKIEAKIEKKKFRI